MNEKMRRTKDEKKEEEKEEEEKEKSELMVAKVRQRYDDGGLVKKYTLNLNSTLQNWIVS